jgi:hypothetical protein
METAAGSQVMAASQGPALHESVAESSVNSTKYEPWKKDAANVRSRRPVATAGKNTQSMYQGCTVGETTTKATPMPVKALQGRRVTLQM